jgi:hypothetical protein
MKSKTGKYALGSLVALLAIASAPLMAQADNAQAAEIASLKRQIYECRHHHHKRVHRTCITSTTNKTVEKQAIIQQPVVVEKVIEKQVQLPAEKEVILEKPMELDRKVVVEHAAHRKHLLHLGIPFIGVTLF